MFKAIYLTRDEEKNVSAEITDLDEGLDILRRLCSEHNVNIDEDEQISLSNIKINAYALYSDSRTYSIEVTIYTTLEAHEDFDKVKKIMEN